MSFSSGNGGRPGMMSEINVTPLVDVMLVLLIIFMVAAPMMTQGLEVNLPKVDSQAIPTEDKQTILTVTVDGKVLLDKIELSSVDNLAYQVKQVMDTKGSQMILIRADREASYGSVAQVMSRLQQAGIVNIGLVTEPAERQGTLPAAGGAGRTS